MMDVALDLDSLPYLQDELYEIRSKWYDIGVQIGIEIGTLQTIRNDSSDSGEALRELLTYWLKNGTPTWEALFKALRSRPVEARTVANRLQREMEDRLFPESVPEARVQYTPTSERCFRIDSLLFPGVSPFVGVPSTRGIEQLNPVFSPSAEVVHIPAVESGVSLQQEYSMMKMPSSCGKIKYHRYHEFKVIVIGESGVGKTSILNRFLNPEIQVKSHRATVEPMKPEGSCLIKIDEDFYVKLTIWDTAGMERIFNAIPEYLFRDVDAALIVFDVQERRTFEKAVSDHTQPDGTTRKSWFKEVNNRSGDIPPIKILVGNMIDCKRKPRAVTKKEAREKAQQLGIDYIETSSLENINIDKIFFKITSLLVDRARSNSKSRPTSGSVNLNRGRGHKPKCRC